MPLTDLQVRRAGPSEKGYKLGDSAGLYLYVTRNGFKSWRLKYRFAGQEKKIVLGSYPQLSLADARKERDRVRALASGFRDPVLEERKARRAAIAATKLTFEKVAIEWHDAQRARWSPLQAKKVIQAFQRDVFPEFGRIPLGEIDPPMVLAVSPKEPSNPIRRRRLARH